MTLQRQIDQLITHRASEWVEILKTGGLQEREAFVDWLCESRKHVAEFLAMAVLDGELNEAVFKDLVDREALLKRVSPRVSELPHKSGHKSGQLLLGALSRSAGWRWPAGLAAGVMALAFVLVWMLKGFPSAQDFATDGGEQRAIELADGSVALLNSASRVQVVMSESSRDLQLLRGEALFKVAKDPRRPFRVHTRDMLVQAVGTQFNVNARRSDTVVSVLEGKVLVSTRDGGGRQLSPVAGVTTLGAGEAAWVDVRGRIGRHALASVEKAASWHQRRLVFQRTALEDVVREFNQHNATPKLRLEGIETASRHYSMIFNADDPRSFADFLGREEDVVIEKRADEIVIRAR